MKSLLLTVLATGCSLTVPAEASDSPELSIPDMAERTVKGVVSITTAKEVPAQFRGMMGEFAPQGVGSGVVIDTSGVVVTNAHVVNGADAVEVTLSDGRVLDALVVGTDPRSDVAVLRIQKAPNDLSALAWGDSDKLRLGETVLAIGNPFGIGHTLTQGIVSAKGRARVGVAEYEDFIQTDAAINPGNSGGALVDSHGRLVGIPTAIFSRSGGTQGIGLAIPAAMAQTIAEDLLEDGKVDRGWLGVAIGPDPIGVLLGEVSVDGAAAKAGLRKGDVVTHFNGSPVEDPTTFKSMVAFAGAGERFDMRVKRQGKTKVIKGTLARRPDDPTN